MANGAFVHELCDSRTFCRKSDIDAMRDQGLIGVYAGASLNNFMSQLRPRAEIAAEEVQMLPSIDDFLPTPTNIHAPETRHRVEVLASLVITDKHARAFTDDERTVGFMFAELRVGMQRTLTINFMQ